MSGGFCFKCGIDTKILNNGVCVCVPCASKPKVKIDNSTQQLKAEIAAIANILDEKKCVVSRDNIYAALVRLRQLSAV